MARLIIQRFLMLLPVLLVISVLVFLMIHSAPGDPVTLITGQLDITTEQEEALREQLGLNEPLHVQFGRWFVRAVQGDLGTSFFGERSVTELIADRLPATIELTVCAMLVALIVGVPAGIISAYKKYTLFDNASMLIALAGVSLPSFWLGLVGIYLLGVKLPVLPVSGRLSAGVELVRITNLLVLDSILRANVAALADALKHLVLPATVLGSVQMAFIARMTRACMLDVLQEDFIRTARAKGLRERAVLLGHAFRNALVPVVTIVGLQVGYLLGGTVIIETVFAWPGLGKLLVDSVLSRDYPVVQGAVMVSAGVFVVTNLVVDVLYAYLDPQMRLT